MTMTSFVYVLDEMRAKDLFLKCNQLIGAGERTKTVREQMKTWRNGERFVEPGAAWTMYNRAGQGLCALLDLEYRPGAPLRVADEDEGFEPECWIEVSFDTAYGWRGPNDEKCGDLHAVLIAQLGQWLDEGGIRWMWRNDHHSGIRSDYESLSDLRSAA